MSQVQASGGGDIVGHLHSLLFRGRRGLWPISNSVHSEYPDRIPFSLFEGDLVSRIFQRLEMGSYRAGDLLKRSLYLIILTWGLLGVLAIWSEVDWTKSPGQNFFMDFAAYGQLLIGLPMFLIAERVIDWQTREAARCFITTGVVQPRDAVRLMRVNWRLKVLRHQVWPDLACGVAA